MATAKKLDLYQQHKSEYVKPRKPVLVETGPAQYLTIDGRGAPESEEFVAKIAAMYGAAFTIKMTRKFAGLGDYKVCALEGLWWADGPVRECLKAPRDQWQWKLLIRVPDFIAAADLKAAKEALKKKGKGPETQEVQLETINEGRCVQVLHVGPYGDEPATMAAMDELVVASGLRYHGRHHEIYLSDPRRVKPEKLKTILRHPVRK